MVKPRFDSKTLQTWALFDQQLSGVVPESPVPTEVPKSPASIEVLEGLVPTEFPESPVPSMVSEGTVEQILELPNVVPESLVEKTIEFWIKLVDSGYRELLHQLDLPQYIDLTQHLQDQVSLLSLHPGLLLI